MRLFRKRTSDPELDTELRYHLDKLVAMHVANGIPPDEAHRRALLDFGGVESMKEACRDHRPRQWLQSFAADLRYGCRRLAKTPGFTALAVVSLALGIGANTALFSLINAALIRLIPVHNPEELVWFHSGSHGRALSYPFYEFVRNDARFNGILAAFPTPVSFSCGDLAERIESELVSGNYFSVLGVRPHLGRLLTEADDRLPIAVLSHAFWRSHLAADPQIVGRTVRINGKPWTIAGVAQPGFGGLDRAYRRSVFVPMGMKPQITPGWNGLDKPLIAWLYIAGRLRPGLDRSCVAADLNGRLQAFQEAHLPNESRLSNAQRDIIRGRRLRLEPLREAVLDTRVARHIGTLSWSVGLLLLLACANVAGLLLARGRERTREIATRLALGATRSRLIMQLLAENLVLASLGGITGLMLGAILAPYLASRFPLTGGGSRLDVPLDATVLAFTFVLSLGCTLLFGLAPAWQSTRLDLTSRLKRKSGSAGLLVAGQAAISIVLLVLAGLFTTNLTRLMAHDTGFARENLLLAEVDPTTIGYNTDRLLPLYGALEMRLSALGDVALADVAPLSPYHGTSLFLIDGRSQEVDFIPRSLKVGPNYFEVMGIPLRRGRYIGLRDEAGMPRVAVISESLARRAFPDQDPIGRRFTGDLRNREASTYEIVGIVADTDLNDPRRRDNRDCVYVGYRQAAFPPQALTIHARSLNAPSAITAIRRAAHDTDPRLVPYDVRKIEEATAEMLSSERLTAVLTGFFGLAAALLCVVGIYGTVARDVAAHIREIGIRIALGAPKWTLLSSLTRTLLAYTVAGVAVGILALLGIAPAVRSLLTDVHPLEPFIIGASVLLLISVATLAAVIPASRASSLDAVTALRED